ncbi:MAG TPA: nickel pincer cofactor biosynthesis protein LarB, partial [Actinomycetota bacterium]|nr:nickel pincer cofactor biosynthesis protein LarB [Actinomycetota bacterium]
GDMRAEEVKDLLIAVKEGRLAPDDAVGLLRELPIDDLGFAQVDIHRELRQGLPETIYAEHKTPEQTVAIAERMLAGTTGPVIATRVPKDAIAALRARFPELAHNEFARVAVLRSEIGEAPRGLVAVITAGTSDLPVAEEAAVVAEACGIKVERVADAGVAGLHRILAARAPLAEADAVIVVAGMEGALPSIVGGLTGAPIIAVPTSVGYGASFDGLSALLGMLNSCAAGVVVCNIDNGFGAAMCALRIVNGKTR